MHVLIHEFVTGGGWYSAGAVAPPESLAREGRAMLQAVATDFLALAGMQVSLLQDAREEMPALAGCTVHRVANPQQEHAMLAKFASEADWTLLVAPEFSNFLLDRARLVVAAGGRLLGPSAQLIELAADKQHTAEQLATAGVPVSQGRLLAAGEPLPADFSYPAVLKPIDGAGSQGIRLIESSCDRIEPATVARRLERFYPGQPASVALVCGPAGQYPLVPCSQTLSGDGRFTYLGGALPIAPALAARAVRLARQAAAALPNAFGYLGVDLVLGPDPAGTEDVVIEVNPRLTTSYVGLRALATTNLAAAMLAVASGRNPPLSWSSQPLQFDAEGHVKPSSCSLQPQVSSLTPNA